MIYKALRYAPITDKFNDKSCLIKNIEIPNINVSEITEVRIKNENSPLNYINNNKDEVVKFKVSYIPLNNSSGIKLFSEALKIISSVKKKDFAISPAVIQTFSNGQDLETITVNDCFPKTASILIEKDVNNNFTCIIIEFVLIGLLVRNF